jgi:hypothetical protein
VSYNHYILTATNLIAPNDFMILGTFNGIFNGNGNTITVNIDLTGAERGLFSVIGASGTVRNLTVAGTVTGGSQTGGLAGRNNGTVENSTSSVVVMGTGDRVGGLIGFNSETGTVTNSHATGNVSGGPGVGQVGGLVGQNHNMITNSLATGNVSGNGNVGGLVGHNWQLDGPPAARIIDSYATGNVRGGIGIGGLVGWNAYGTVNNSEARNTTVTTAGTGSVGRVVGGTLTLLNITNNRANVAMDIRQATAADGTGGTVVTVTSDENGLHGENWTSPWVLPQ